MKVLFYKIVAKPLKKLKKKPHKLIATIVTLISLFIPFNDFFIKSAEPVYTFFSKNDIIIKESRSEFSSLSIMMYNKKKQKPEKITNLHSRVILIWNKGNDDLVFPKNADLWLESSNIKYSKATLIKTSSSSLLENIISLNDTNPNKIIINFCKELTLKESRGFAIQLLYSFESQEIDWKFRGTVKGIDFKNYDDENSAKSIVVGQTRIILKVLLFLIIISIIFLIYFFIKIYNSQENKTLWVKVSIGILSVFLVISSLSGEIINIFEGVDYINWYEPQQSNMQTCKAKQ